MRTLPETMIRVLAPFAPLFFEHVWWHVQVLLAGAILAPGKRTVCSALRAVGLDQEKRFHRYHRVLSRASWSSRESEPGASEIARGGVRARRSAGSGHRRDPRAAPGQEDHRQGHLPGPGPLQSRPLREDQRSEVGVRDVFGASLMGLSGVGLALLCTLAPSERYANERGKRHKRLTEWAWQLLLLVRRWYPERGIVTVADGGYASLKLLDRCRRLTNPITFITHLRLDAALYKPAAPRKAGQRGRPRLKDERLANLSIIAEDPTTDWKQITVDGWYAAKECTLEIVSGTAVWYSTGLPAVPLRWVLIRAPQEEFEPQALLCTYLDADPGRIISWFVRHWQMETTFQEVRVRLGFETQRHWSEMAIQRTAPALLALFSLVTLFAHQQKARMPEIVRRAA